MSSHSGEEFGRITFEFETSCTADCELYFMMVRRVTDMIAALKNVTIDFQTRNLPNESFRM